MVVVIIAISVIVFVLNYMVADPVSAMLGVDVPPQAHEVYRHQMGFDRPIMIQYLEFAQGAIVGNFGNSFRLPAPALGLVMDRMPATLLLTFTGMGLAILISLPLGILAAYRRHTLIDNICTVIAVAGQAMPIYWLGLILMIIFGVRLKWLPVSGYGTPAHLIMPAFCLGVFTAPVAMRLVRSGMLEVLDMDYIRSARAKGLAEKTVLLRHGLRNTLIPVITLLGLQFGQLLGGAIVTETVFAWPGVAQLAVNSIVNADLPVVQAAVIMLAVIITVVNLVVDIAVGLLDPRIRIG
ncbi:MAG: ABC transporter permease [Chloroflexi bacterium]|nr:ABC transporter permease [Chloroflexota bacterium]